MKREWTQADCANHFGVLKDSYQKWEWNKITPVICRRKMVCNFLGYNYWDDSTESLANQCLLYRVENKLTQAELVNILNISRRTIERLEAGSGDVSNIVELRIKSFFVNEIKTDNFKNRKNYL